MSTYLNGNNASKKVEIKIKHKQSVVTLTFDPNDTLNIMREAIKINLSYGKIAQFEIYSGKYHLNDVLNDLKIIKLNESFLSNNYEVIPIGDRNPFEIVEYVKNPDTKVPIKKGGKFVMNIALPTPKTLDQYMQDHVQSVERYLSIYDVEESTYHHNCDMEVLVQHLAKMYDEICKEEEYLKKNGLLFLHDQLMLKVEEFEAIKEQKERYLDGRFIKIIELKKLEKDAVEDIKENKKMVTMIHSGILKINNKIKEISNLTTKRKFF